MAQNVEFVSDKEAALIKQELNSCIRENRPVIASTFMNEKLISFWLLVKSIKEDAIYLCRNNGPKAYIGQTPIGGEGYVYSNEYGTFKLVNREQFSYANFNNTKFSVSWLTSKKLQNSWNLRDLSYTEQNVIWFGGITQGWWLTRRRHHQDVMQLIRSKGKYVAN